MKTPILSYSVGINKALEICTMLLTKRHEFIVTLDYSRRTIGVFTTEAISDIDALLEVI